MSKRTGRSAEPLLPVGRAEATDRELGRLWRYVDVLSRALRHLPSTSAAADGSPDDPCDPIAAADHVLIRGFVAHQPGAAEAVAARLTIIPRILGALCRRLGSPLTPHDLEDLAQDAMAIALRKLGQVGPRVPLDAWLHRLCNYELCNSLRRRYRHTSEELPPELASRDAAAIQQFERRELLFQALERLPADGAAIVRLHQLEGRTLAEIAALLRLTENTVKGRYYRAIERLTEILRHHRPDREEP